METGYFFSLIAAFASRSAAARLTSMEEDMTLEIKYCVQ